jgi:hypothetical protein
MDGPNSPWVKSAEEMVGRFQGELISLLPGWKERLKRCPEELASLEREVHIAHARGADLLIVGLVSMVMKEKAFAEACEQTRKRFRHPLERGRMRKVRVRLLGGLLMWVSSLYCAPRRTDGDKDAKVPGLHVELAQFGFGKGCTPGLQVKVARQAALCPSLQFAQQELERDGVQLDVKTVRRITYQCGEGLLHLRKHQLLLWREGKLVAGNELAGKRVSVQLDGGRTRIRGELRDKVTAPELTDTDGMLLEDAPGRSRKRPKRTFDGDWREPKLLTIFVHDERGRMEKQSEVTVDGTFMGPDALAELIAMHLHRLGAAKALSITFVADGGVWIWDRLPTIVRHAQLQDVPIYEVLDCYHAAHHISLALAALGLDEKRRMPLYREYRTLLRNGQWRRVVEEITEFAADEPTDSKVWTEINYLRKHGEAARLKYPTFKSLGLPLGSGAIESNIRRVVNLRMKGNSIYWREDEGEAMLQVRAQVLTHRLDQRMRELQNLKLRDSRTDWHWEPKNMSVKNECADTSPTKP